MMDKAFIDGKIIDVVSESEYQRNPGIYKPGEVGIEMNGYVLPVRATKYDYDTVGYYPGQVFNRMTMPHTEDEIQNYSSEHVANFQNVNTLRELVEEQNKINTEQIMYLTTSDNIFAPQIDPINDTPLMAGFKQAVIDKQIDINKYSSRFGNDFNNDRRKFNLNRISLDKFVSIGGKLDMKATLIIEDKNPNVPNPIGHKIVVDLIPTDGEE